MFTIGGTNVDGGGYGTNGGKVYMVNGKCARGGGGM